MSSPPFKFQREFIFSENDALMEQGYGEGEGCVFSPQYAHAQILPYVDINFLYYIIIYLDIELGAL